MEPRDESALTVRTVTVFLSADHCRDPSTFQASLSTACTIANAVRDCLITAGVSVQTIRLSVPGPAVFGSPSSALRAAKSLDIAAVDYASLGTVHPDDDATFLDSSFFSEVINTTSTVFLSLTTTSSTGEPSLLAIRRAAETISRLAKDDPSGLENMRFAALSNVRPGCPFFPASFSSSTSPTSDAFPVALGVQAAPLLHTGPLSELPCRVENAAQILVDACKSVQDVACDFSTAPLPGWRTSAAASIARIAGGRKGGFGKPGTLAAAASVASALDRAKFPRAGLCGIMLPVAEDTALTRSERPLRLNDLLMTSAVCGTGLDMIPLPGNTPVPVLQRVVADVAALSARLGRKQLTVRLLPIPGKKSGDITEFDSPFLVNGPVLEVDALQETGSDFEELRIDPLHQY